MLMVFNVPKGFLGCISNGIIWSGSDRQAKVRFDIGLR